MYEEACIIILRAQRIRWLGHIERIENHKMINIFTTKPIQSKRLKRPIWMETMREHLQKMHIRAKRLRTRANYEDV